MDSYVAIGIFVIIVMEVGGLIVLGMQLRAYRHHRHPSLLVLSLSSVIGLAYGAVASLGYFVHDPRLFDAPFALLCAALAIPATVLSVAGVGLLFTSYRQLVDANVRAQARIAALEAQLPGPALPPPTPAAQR